MSLYKVICHATEEIEIEVNKKDEAEELAVELSQFPYVDYCETEEN